MPEQGVPDGGCEREIFTVILRGLPALKPELSAACLSSQASLSPPGTWQDFAGQRGGRKWCWEEGLGEAEA